MKSSLYNIQKFVIMSVAALMCSCGDDVVPAPTADEDYTKGFARKFGIIDPRQDWNAATQTGIVFYPGEEGAQTVDVLINCCGNYYLAATYHDVDIPVRMNLEIPEGVDELCLAIDGRLYRTTPGGVVDMRELSRAEGDEGEAGEAGDEGEAGEEEPDVPTHDIEYAPEEYDNLGWLIAAEDMGDSDDFDFNDVIVKLEYDAMTAGCSLTPLDWELNGNDANIQMAKSRAVDPGLRVTAMAAGGQLSVWLHFVVGGVDYVLSPNAPNGYIAKSSVNENNKYVYEWHQWFRPETNSVSKPVNNIINTGLYEGRGREVVLPKSLIGSGFTFTSYSKPYSPASASTDNINGFYIEVENLDENGEIITASESGAAPKMFLIPDIGWGSSAEKTLCGWFWPHERVSIESAYTLFPKWVNDAETYKQWYTQEKNPANGDVHNRKY